VLQQAVMLQTAVRAAAGPETVGRQPPALQTGLVAAVPAAAGLALSGLAATGLAATGLAVSGLRSGS
jgi:hypothetical protein